MPAYHFKFMKKSDGDDSSQKGYRSIVIHVARDGVRAVAAAKRRFERLESIRH
jgi:hypothetical protein